MPRMTHQPMFLVYTWGRLRASPFLSSFSSLFNNRLIGRIGGTHMFTLGFDVAKDHVDAALINRSGQCKQRYQVTNTVDALALLLRTVRKQHKNLQIGCEATGPYHLPLVQAA